MLSRHCIWLVIKLCFHFFPNPFSNYIYLKWREGTIYKFNKQKHVTLKAPQNQWTICRLVILGVMSQTAPHIPNSQYLVETLAHTHRCNYHNYINSNLCVINKLLDPGGRDPSAGSNQPNTKQTPTKEPLLWVFAFGGGDKVGIFNYKAVQCHVDFWAVCLTSDGPD